MTFDPHGKNLGIHFFVFFLYGIFLSRFEIEIVVLYHIFYIKNKAYVVAIQIKSSLYLPYYAETCSKLRGPSPLLSAWATQLRRNVVAVASRWRHCADLTGSGIESGSARYRSGRSVVQIPGRSNRQCRQRLATAATFLRSCAAQTLSRGDEPRHSLHASAYYREYDEDLCSCFKNKTKLKNFCTKLKLTLMGKVSPFYGTF